MLIYPQKTQWNGSAKKEVKSGTSVFTIAGEDYCFELESFEDHIEIGEALKAAYVEGRRDSASHISNAIDQAMTKVI